VPDDADIQRYLGILRDARAFAAPSGPTWGDLYRTYTVGGRWSLSQIGEHIVDAYADYNPLRIEANRIELQLAEVRHQEERRLASREATAVLRRFMTADQRREFDLYGRFHVTGSEGRPWLIEGNGQVGNLILLDANDSMVAAFCAHPSGGVVDPAAWLAQMLALQNDEEDVINKANCQTRPYWRPAPVTSPGAQGRSRRVAA